MKYHCYESTSESYFYLCRMHTTTKVISILSKHLLCPSREVGEIFQITFQKWKVFLGFLSGFIFHIHKIVTDKYPNINSYISKQKFKSLLVEIFIYKTCLSQNLYLYGLQEKHLRWLKKTFNI